MITFFLHDFPLRKMCYQIRNQILHELDGHIIFLSFFYGIFELIKIQVCQTKYAPLSCRLGRSECHTLRVTNLHGKLV